MNSQVEKIRNDIRINQLKLNGENDSDKRNKLLDKLQLLQAKLKVAQLKDRNE